MNDRFGLPTAASLRQYRIWDCYFTPAHSHPGGDGRSRLEAEIKRAMPTMEMACFEHATYFAHVGLGTTGDDALEVRLRSQPNLVEWPLQQWPGLLTGMIQLNAHRVEPSLDAIERWIRRGPMVGAYFPGGGPAALACSDRRCEPLVERLSEVGGVIVQHTWYKTGGKQSAGETTPAELAELARRFPNQKFVCAHAGGEWERGIRAVRDVPNILIETSGFDATAGFIEMAIRELGPRRILFGSHLPSRSLGTELSKVLGADVSEPNKQLILGANYRRLLGVG